MCPAMAARPGRNAAKTTDSFNEAEHFEAEIDLGAGGFDDARHGIPVTADGAETRIEVHCNGREQHGERLGRDGPCRLEKTRFGKPRAVREPHPDQHRCDQCHLGDQHEADAQTNQRRPLGQAGLQSDVAVRGTWRPNHE